MPTTVTTMRLVEHEGGTRMELRSTSPSLEATERLDEDEMGMAEGLRLVVGQMDALLVA